MPPTVSNLEARASLFTRRNLLLIGVAILTIAAGYAVLVHGAASAASVLLVIGYCVLFPLALII
ncbi:MAG TPA: hypothetical protein VGM77_13145 [Gemmatimonadales bacterium]|jgi:hypothetical protein